MADGLPRLRASASEYRTTGAAAETVSHGAIGGAWSASGDAGGGFGAFGGGWGGFGVDAHGGPHPIAPSTIANCYGVVPHYTSVAPRPRPRRTGSSASGDTASVGSTGSGSVSSGGSPTGTPTGISGKSGFLSAPSETSATGSTFTTPSGQEIEFTDTAQNRPVLDASGMALCVAALARGEAAGGAVGSGAMSGGAGGVDDGRRF
mmetsp:Transcript_106777/g.297104  ORF Transcript_106777/g.297104 Transcript_106777/m.297104 type:complete len:205 (+) Transcript_106777:116-730(+)